MSTPYYRFPQPFLNRVAIAGERLRVGGLVEFRPDPTDKRRLLLFNHQTPGGNHSSLYAAPDRGLEYYEAGDQALYVQFFGEVQFHAVLRRGEKVSGGQHERGRMRYGSPLVSAGDGTGALVHGSRFVNAARICGSAIEDLDLSDAEEDQLVRIRTSIYLGEVQNAG